VLRAQVNVITTHNDNARTGANTQETILTPANVNSTKFGKLFSVAVDGYVYAQPLYLSGVTINGGTHNVLYVATEHDSLYALDANTGAILWQVSFINPANLVTTVSTADVNCTDIQPEIGITATPVIETTTHTIYVLARTKENGSLFQRLHAIDTITGAEKFGGPVVIHASVAGTGDGSNGGTLLFDPQLENPRAGLLLQNGHVIMGWSSLCDVDPYHGWVMSYNAGTLAQEAVFNDTPNGSEGGIWMAGAGFAGDSNGNTFFATGNGTFNGTDEFGDSIVKLAAPASGSLSFPLSDYFTPYNQATLASGDLDLGSGGPLLLPDLPAGSAHPHLLALAGKQGTIYLINRDNLGHYCNGCSSDTQIVQEIPGALAGQMGAPAYWNGSLYFGSERELTNTADHVKAFSFNAGGSGLISTAPTSQTPETFFFPAVSPSVSANGTSNGIVWLLDNAAFGGACCQVLHAYDATNLASELYNTNQAAGGRDALGSGVKFTVPTVVNGKVYVGGLAAITAYGLLNPSGGGAGISLATKAYGAYHNSSATASSITSSAFALPPGDLIVAYCGNTSSTASTPTISDTASNAFHQAGATAAGSGGDSLSMFYAANAKGISNDVVTCTWTAAQNNLAVIALVYSGADASAPLDATGSGFIKGGTSLQTSLFSTTSANEVIVAGMMSGSSCVPAPAPGSGYTMELSAVPSGCGGPVAAAEDKVVSTLQMSATASMTFPSATYADMIVATFKAGP